MDRRTWLGTLGLQTGLLGGVMCAMISLLLMTFDSNTIRLARVAVRIAPLTHWLDEESEAPGAVVHVDRWFLRTQDAPTLASKVPLSDRAGVRSLLVLLRRGEWEGGLTLVPEDDVSTQQLVSVAEDAATAGFDDVGVRLEP